MKRMKKITMAIFLALLLAITSFSGMSPTVNGAVVDIPEQESEASNIEDVPSVEDPVAEDPAANESAENDGEMDTFGASGRPSDKDIAKLITKLSDDHFPDEVIYKHGDDCNRNNRRDNDSERNRTGKHNHDNDDKDEECGFIIPFTIEAEVEDDDKDDRKGYSGNNGNNGNNRDDEKPDFKSFKYTIDLSVKIEGKERKFTESDICIISECDGIKITDYSYHNGKLTITGTRERNSDDLPKLKIKLFVPYCAREEEVTIEFSAKFDKNAQKCGAEYYDFKNEECFEQLVRGDFDKCATFCIETEDDEDIAKLITKLSDDHFPDEVIYEHGDDCNQNNRRDNDSERNRSGKHNHDNDDKDEECGFIIPFTIEAEVEDDDKDNRNGYSGDNENRENNRDDEDPDFKSFKYTIDLSVKIEGRERKFTESDICIISECDGIKITDYSYHNGKLTITGTRERNSDDLPKLKIKLFVPYCAREKEVTIEFSAKFDKNAQKCGAEYYDFKNEECFEQMVLGDFDKCATFCIETEDDEDIAKLITKLSDDHFPDEVIYEHGDDCNQDNRRDNDSERNRSGKHNHDNDDNDGECGFIIPFTIETEVEDDDKDDRKGYSGNNGNNRDDEKPDFKSFKYTIDLSVKIEGRERKFTESDICIISECDGIKITDYSYHNGKLTITGTRERNSDDLPKLKIKLFVPYCAREEEVTIEFSAKFDKNAQKCGAEYYDFKNEECFEQLVRGDFDKCATFCIETEDDELIIQDDIQISERNNKITQTLKVVNGDFVELKDSQFMLLLDSKVAYFGEHSTFVFESRQKDGGIESVEIPANQIKTLFAYVNLEKGYNPNDIFEKIEAGKIKLESYEKVLQSGHKPNIVVAEVLKDFSNSFSGHKDGSFVFKSFKEYVNYTDDESKETFKEDYDSNKVNESFVYSYISLKTNFKSVEKAEEKYERELARVDKFVKRHGNVFLELGTTKEPSSAEVHRFNCASIVRACIRDPFKPEPTITKMPENQQVNFVEGTHFSFDIELELPRHLDKETSFVVTDVLDPSIRYDANGSTLTIEVDGKETTKPLDATVLSGNELEIALPPEAMKDCAILTIHLNVFLFDSTLVPDSMIIANEAKLHLSKDNDGNKTDVIVSNEVTVEFISVDEVTIRETPLKQEVDLIVGTHFVYDITVLLPHDVDDIDSLTVTDVLHPSIRYDASGSTLTVEQGASSITTPLNATVTGNEIKVELPAEAIVSDATIIIHLDVFLSDIAKVPDSMEIKNHATLIVNGEDAISKDSNEVTVEFVSVTDFGTVIVNYLEFGTNKVLASSETLTGQVGTPFTTTQKTVQGFTFFKVVPNAIGFFTEAPQEVNYYYVKTPPTDQGTVVVEYVELGTDNEIASPEVLTGTIGTSFTTTQKTISGFTFVKVAPSATGVYTNQIQQVTYYYTKTVTPDMGTVVVRYLDKDTNVVIAQGEVETGLIGSPYTTAAKTVNGYVLVSIDGIPNGNYVSGTRIVTYLYQRVTPAPSPNPSRPKTGDNNTLLMPVIAGLALMSIGFGLYLKKKKRSKNQ